MAIEDAPYPYEVGDQTVVTWVPTTMGTPLVKPENKEATFIAEVTEVKEQVILAIEIIKMLDTPDGLKHFKVGQRLNHTEFNFAFLNFRKINKFLIN
ncbi:hypothetical protein [Anabaena sp. AL09]|uniref:hypothetical protein n=1 Tax=Anabaena sp. AL09 TaxID=1710891 RepID=UPI001A1C1A2B|nr:hypothetical protein [Anabaena sp. AL09]MBJ7298500.1 hypothetical protein [Dolichospermum sp.]